MKTKLARLVKSAISVPFAMLAISAIFCVVALLLIVAFNGWPQMKFVVNDAYNLVLAHDGRHAFIDVELADATRKKWEFLETGLDGETKKRLSGVQLVRPALSHTGRFLAAVTTSWADPGVEIKEGLQIYSAKSLVVKKTLTGKGEGSKAIWFPVSERLLYQKSGTIFIYDVLRDERSRILSTNLIPQAISDDERFLALGTDEAALDGTNKVWVMPLREGAKPSVLARLKGAVDQMAFNKRRLVVAVREQKKWTLVLIDPADGRVTTIRRGGRGIAGLRSVPERDAVMYGLTSSWNHVRSGVLQTVIALNAGDLRETVIAERVGEWDYNADKDILVWLPRDWGELSFKVRTRAFQKAR